MIYRVRAHVVEARLAEFYGKLTDGTIAAQRPDGAEILASMKRAVLTAPGVAEWYEMCLCPSPLFHERATQYDYHFEELTTEEADDYGHIEGESLWSYMEAKASSL